MLEGGGRGFVRSPPPGFGPALTTHPSRFWPCPYCSPPPRFLAPRITRPLRFSDLATCLSICWGSMTQHLILHTVKSTIQFSTILGVLLTKTCYYPRRATIAINKMSHLLFLPECRILKNSDQIALKNKVFHSIIFFKIEQFMVNESTHIIYTM